LIYYPCTKSGDDNTYLRFLDTVNTLIRKILKNSKVIIGTNINSNIGTSTDIHATDFHPALGPHGIP
jgi:hypothetical protein